MAEETNQQEETVKEVIEYYESVIELKAELGLPYKKEKEELLNIKESYGTDK